MKIALFAYNFPHKKTQDFIFRLFCEGFNIQQILACDPVELNIPPSTIRTKIRHGALLHPHEIAKRLSLPYVVLPHNDPKAAELIKSQQIDLGVIAGARILKGPVINAFRIGVINFHPGLIPEARGLDALLWSIHHAIPLGVTAHLIDERVDAGTILLKQEIAVHNDDTLLDLSERLYETQLEMVTPAIEAAMQESGEPLPPGTKLNRKMPAETEQQILSKLPSYVARFSSMKGRA